MEECLFGNAAAYVLADAGTAEADFMGTRPSMVLLRSVGTAAWRPIRSLHTIHRTSAYGFGDLPGYHEVFPVLENAKIVRAWAGWIDKCVDAVPVIDTVSEVPGLILACAFTGHGFGISPAVGLTVSELVQGLPTTVPIDQLKYDRFKSKI